MVLNMVLNMGLRHILNDLLKIVTIFLACDKSTQVRIKDIESPMAILVLQHR